VTASPSPASRHRRDWLLTVEKRRKKKDIKRTAYPLASTGGKKQQKNLRGVRDLDVKRDIVAQTADGRFHVLFDSRSGLLLRQVFESIANTIASSIRIHVWPGWKRAASAVDAGPLPQPERDCWLQRLQQPPRTVVLASIHERWDLRHCQCESTAAQA